MFDRILEDEEVRNILQDEAMKLPDIGIVVSGISGRFPRADSVNELEECLLNGVDMLNENDGSRFECGLWDLPPRAGRLNDLTKFDNEFFNITVDEANQTDHQVRIMYEVVYEAILDAGVNPAQLRGSKTGVFFGTHCNEFDNILLTDPNARGVGYFAQHARLIAEYFDLKGITASYDTACGSGFSALTSAVEAIDQGLIEQAIVASSTIPVNPTITKCFLELKMLSPTGYCRYLDSKADGYAKSEACVAIFIRRESLALRNYCSFMSMLTGADGYKDEGITFPSVKGQESLVRRAKQAAGISTNHVEYLEAHGTGTAAGDPIESEALSNVYFESDETSGVCKRKIGPLLVGSCKTNMGHPEGASGLCALTKVALMLENEIIYKSLHYEQPNPNVKSLLEGKLKPVEENCKLRAKIIPISNYGFGGANAHAIVRCNERSAIKPGEYLNSSDKFEPRLIVMFGRSERLLNDFFDSMLDEQSRYTRNCLTDDFLALLDSLSAGKIDRLMNYRGYMIIDRRSTCVKRELSRQIKCCNLEQASNCADSNISRHFQETKPRVCNLIFPGLGCEWTAMAAGLVQYEPFWSTIERLSDILSNCGAKCDLISLLTCATKEDLKQKVSNLFVCIVAYQVALTNIVRDQLQLNHFGSTVGHSIGEVACAYAAGLLNERQAIMVAYNLGKALDENRKLVAGKMVAVNVSEQEALKLVREYKTLRVSCINGPQSVTVSGTIDEIDEFCVNLRAQDKIHLVEINSCLIALHNESIMVEDIRGILKRSVIEALKASTEHKQSCSIEWYSSVSRELKSNRFGEASAEYFAECLCKKVDFHTPVTRLEDNSIALELGPSGIFASQLLSISLTKAINNDQEEGLKLHYVKLMSGSISADCQILYLLRGLGDLYLVGATFNNLTLFHHNQSQKAIDKVSGIYPVKRQTPSISSLFKWKKGGDFFVPRYPTHFSVSFAKSDVMVDILHERDMYKVDHQIEGRVLFPATGYLLFVWSYFGRALTREYFTSRDMELVPAEFYNVKLYRAAMLTREQATVFDLSLNESTGQFEVSESGSVLVQGYIRIPEESPSDLIYGHVMDKIKEENINANEVKSEDVYKQFRVNGYDYGKCFQNILSSSIDGRRVRVKYNSHFDSFTDSMLQTLILSMKQSFPTNGLFLPTGFEYVRFQPDIILKKLKQTGLQLKPSEGGSRSWFGKEEKNKQSNTSHEKNAVLKDCVFDVYCDPVTGVIITDGIEMRGVKTTLAPRRLNNQQVQLESYQFVKDVEDPIEDKNIDGERKEYGQICDSMAASLLAKMCRRKCTQLNGLNYDLDKHLHAVDQNADWFESRYVKKFLSSLNKVGQDLILNGDFRLMSILDMLFKETITSENARRVLAKSEAHLKHDFIQSGFISERSVRSLLETVVESTCKTKAHLRALEINENDIEMKEALVSILHTINPSLAVDYLLSRASSKPIKAGSLDNEGCKLSKVKNLLEESKMRDLNLIIWKDLSCSGVLIKQIQQLQIRALISSMAKCVTNGGFVMIALRQELTLAERFVLLLHCNFSSYLIEEDQIDENEKLGLLISELNKINKALKLRCDTFVDEALEANLMLCSKKRDSNGCTWLLFRKTQKKNLIDVGHKHAPRQETIIRVTHDNNISVWLEAIKASFVNVQACGLAQGDKIVSSSTSEHDKHLPNVWLCAVETRQQPVNGLIGMMQALKKELGSQRLRCFYDSYTFKHCDEPVSVQQIKQSNKFRQALERDFILNCIDSDGNFGSFRHFTINDYFNYNECLCANNRIDEESSTKFPAHYSYVNYAKRGDLSSFSWFEAPFKYLCQEEFDNLHTVAYAALNFRDVMLSTGRLSFDALSPEVALQDCAIGMEFSGINSNNERVMGMVSCQAIATHVLCPKDEALLIKVPDWLSLAEAATIPVVYATAILALIYRGKMQRGESILIHAGSGGVGQAAIRLAAHYGLTIYTTVGSEEKRKFLLEEFADYLSDERIFSSRDCVFEDRIMKMTKGFGVDLVLNSLADDKLQASIRCLADGGRFLEIGKYDMSMDSQLELNKLDTNKTFQGISLDKLFDLAHITEPFQNQIEGVLRTIAEGLEYGYVKPIKHMIFNRNQVEQAFRYMATGKHIGKVLIGINASLDSQSLSRDYFRPKVVPRFQLSREKSYIVTGGLGGFGLELVKWLVSKGACNIVLTSRVGITTSYQRMTLDKLASGGGVKFLIADKQTADTTCIQGVEKLCDMALDLSPKRQIGAIFHLAMVLKDSLLENMTAEDFELVCRPKVETFIHLDKVARDRKLELDYCVAFSSVTSGKGNVGQANYAYANSCLERICEKRRASGLHGLAIQWGAIGDVGVAFENLGGNDVIIGGTVPQRIPSCMNTLSKILCSPFTVCLSVVPATKSGNSNTSKADLVCAVLNVLGFKDQSKIKEGATLGELGLDSLMAVEIGQYVQRELEVTLSFQETRALTIEKIRQLANDSKTTTKGKSANDDRATSMNNEKLVKTVDNYGQQSKGSAGSATYNPYVSTGFFDVLPLIKLPQEKFIHLNNVSCGKQRPIFFIPPFHGHFKELERVCSLITRPCLGINWTHAFSKASTMAETVDIYIDLLANTNWKVEFGYNYALDESDKRVVDLVGYSFGATVAFEIMSALQDSTVITSSCKQNKPLKAGKLVLIDGSPKQVEIGSMILKNLSKSMTLEEKVDQLLLAYTNSHTTNYNVMYDEIALSDDLSACKLETKSSLMGAHLFGLLKHLPDFLANFNEISTEKNFHKWHSEMQNKASLKIAKAIDVFYRKFIVVLDYRATQSRSLRSDCTIIKSDEPLFHLPEDIAHKLGNDMGLKDFVEGKISAFNFKGDHSKFLDDNHRQIAEIIIGSF